MASTEARVTAECRQVVDDAADWARRKYLGNSPWVIDTMRTTLLQANAYLAAVALDVNAAVPAYIAANATYYSKAPTEVCNKLISDAAAFDNVTGPEIERQRLIGYTAMKAATNAEEMTAARDAAVAALQAI